LQEVSYEEAIAFAVDALKRADRQVAGWASPADSNEELFLFRRLFREVLQSPHLDHRSTVVADAEPDDTTLPIADIERCDHVVVLGGQEVIDAAPVLHLRLLKSQRKGVNVLRVGTGLKALYVHESSPLHGFTPTDAESMWLPALPLLIVHRFTASPLDDLAHVILPGHAFTEKDGSVTSMEGRVQRIRKGIDAEW